MKTYQAPGKLNNQALEVIVKAARSSHVKVHEPTFDCNEWTYLKKCLDSTYVSLAGKFVSVLVNFTGVEKNMFSSLIGIPSSVNIGLRK
jgi:hypothetical protein